MSPSQCRAARGWLRWPVKTLAVKAGVCTHSIYMFERERTTSHRATLAALEQAFARAGVHMTRSGKTEGIEVRP